METEPVQLEDKRIADALEDVERCRKEIKVWQDEVERRNALVTTNVEEMTKFSIQGFSSDVFAAMQFCHQALKECVEFAEEFYKKAKEDLVEAEERLDKLLEKRNIEKLLGEKLHVGPTPPPFVSSASTANSCSLGNRYMHCSPVNHPCAVKALMIMEELEEINLEVMENLMECSEEILTTLSKASYHDQDLGLFNGKYEAHREKSMTAFMTQILAEKIKNMEGHGLRWFHQFQDPIGCEMDICMYVIPQDKRPCWVWIPSAIIEVGLLKRRRSTGSSASSMQLQTMASRTSSTKWKMMSYLINQCHALTDTRNQIIFTVELELNFSEFHYIFLRCGTVANGKKLWNSTIWQGEVTKESLARVLYVLMIGAHSNSQKESSSSTWDMLGPDCALNHKTNKVFKCFDYRYSDPSTYRRSPSFGQQTLKTQTLIECGRDLVVITYDYVQGDHFAKRTHDFIPILKKLQLLHGEGVVHGDIRLSNLVFASDPRNSTLIDLDFAGPVQTRKYPLGFNVDIQDGYRHWNAKGDASLEYEHDWYAMSSLMKNHHFLAPSKDENTASEVFDNWSKVCEEVSKGKLESAITMLEQTASVSLQFRISTFDPAGSPERRKINESGSKRIKQKRAASSMSFSDQGG